MDVDVCAGGSCLGFLKIWISNERERGEIETERSKPLGPE